MATGLVIHISSGDDKHTEVLTDERIRIGSRDDCDLRLRMSDLPKRSDGDGLVVVTDEVTLSGVAGDTGDHALARRAAHAALAAVGG